jgi:hypothetical protein
MELCLGGIPEFAEKRAQLLEEMRKHSSDIPLQREEEWMRTVMSPQAKIERSTRPVDEVHKVASMAGQDMRSPAKVSPPTMDSLGPAISNLKDSQGAAELQFNSKPTIQNTSPKMATTKGSIPKMASQRLLTDPLVQYLQKTAKLDVADPIPNGDSVLPNNIADMKHSPEVQPRVKEDPNPDPTLEEAVPETYRYLDRMFSNSKFRKKYKDKELGDKENG